MKVKVKVCKSKTCENEFHKKRKEHKYCSTNCRKKAYRERLKKEGKTKQRTLETVIFEEIDRQVVKLKKRISKKIG